MVDAWVVLWFVVLRVGSGVGRWTVLVLGGIVALVALIRAGPAYRLSWLSYANAVVGVAILSKAVWVGETGAAHTNSAVGGVLITILSLISASESDRARTTSAGRR